MPTVLLAEAAASVRDLVKAMLRREDLTFAEAQDASEALLAAHDRRPALVILDQNLPPWGGLEFLRRIRRLDDVPVVVLALHDHALEPLLSNGAREILLKPLDAWKLVAVAESILGAEPAELPAPSGRGHE